MTTPAPKLDVTYPDKTKPHAAAFSGGGFERTEAAFEECAVDSDDGQFIGTIICGHDGRRDTATALSDQCFAALAANIIPECSIYLYADSAPHPRLLARTAGTSANRHRCYYSRPRQSDRTIYPIKTPIIIPHPEPRDDPTNY
jgi:hypothetical protein